MNFEITQRGWIISNVKMSSGLLALLSIRIDFTELRRLSTSEYMKSS